MSFEKLEVWLSLAERTVPGAITITHGGKYRPHAFSDLKIILLLNATTFLQTQISRTGESAWHLEIPTLKPERAPRQES